MGDKKNDQTTKPPRLADRFLEWYCHPYLLEEIQGDLYESFYRNVKSSGTLKAKWIYWLYTIGFFKPSNIRNLTPKYSPVMFKNYFISALRNLWKSKLYSVINIGGLSLGLAVAVLILIYVDNENSYDNWIPDNDQIYRVYRHWPSGNGGAVWTPDPLAEQLKEDFAEVNESAGLFPVGETMLEYEQKKFFVDDVAMVDSTFFEVIALPLKYGQQKNILQAPNAVVVSERVAELFFGATDPIGKTLRYNDDLDLIISGVFQVLGNSHLPYEVYTRFTWGRPAWTSNNRATYIKSNSQTDITALEDKITERVNEFRTLEYNEMGVKPTAEELPEWHLQPLADIHLHSGNLGWMSTNTGDIRYVYVFSLIAFIVLLIGAINYINLSTARALGRAREVGVRKVTGARRIQLISQFLMETVVQAFLALSFSVALIELFLPGFNHIVSRELLFLQGNWVTWLLPMIGLTLIVGLLAGIYPAFVMSSFKPVKVLKSLTRGKDAVSFRRGLVVVQFSLSVVFVIVMLFIYKQINYMMSQDLGFSGEQVFVVPFNTRNGSEQLNRLEKEFKDIPGVKNFTAGSRMPGPGYPDWSMEIEGKDEVAYPRILIADVEYANVLGLEMVDGRFFSRDHPSDSVNAVVVNQAFIKENNIKDPFNTKVRFSGEEDYLKIIGVVKDYHYQSLDRSIRPMTILLGTGHNYAGFLVDPTNLPNTLASIEKLWKEVEPAHPMRSSFLDEDFAGLYEEYRRFGQALFYATALAIFVAILGLFGLATYSTMRRTKEIGVRKVLGASVRQLSLMLVSGFIRWVLLAGLIAAPIGYYLSRNILQEFAYRTAISIWPFIAAIFFSILIAAFTVSFQAISAALRNPVEALRHE